MSNIVSLEDYKRRRAQKAVMVPTTHPAEAVVNKRLDDFFQKLKSPDQYQEQKRRRDAERQKQNQFVKNSYKLDK